jgi:hypothetical protein
MLPDHNPAQSYKEECQKKPTHDALDYDVVSIPSHRQEVDWPLREKNTGAEEQSDAKNRSFRNGVLLDRTLQGLG